MRVCVCVCVCARSVESVWVDVFHQLTVYRVCTRRECMCTSVMFFGVRARVCVLQSARVHFTKL